MESGDLLARVIEGLGELSINLIVTVGPTIDPAEFGSQPAHVQIEKQIPQSSILPHCDLVVSHGGSGSVIGALAHGLPSVLIPIGADQPLNGDRCVALGFGQVLDAFSVTPQIVRAAATSVLDDPTYRRNAELLRDEIAALPEPSHGVRLLERFAHDRQALPSE
jgi:MGT family glycosyltransferase